VFDAGVNSDGFEQAGGDEAVAFAVEVQQRERGLPAADPVLVAQPDDGVGESGALLGGVDLFVDGGQRVPAPLGIVVFDCFAQALEVRTDQSWQCDQQRAGRSMSSSARWSSTRSESPSSLWIV
jgi:hypothetical protein